MRFILIMILALSPICFGLRADLNRDGIVDIQDFAIFAGEWLMSEYGSDLVTNGTFSTDTAWDKGASWTISSNKANYSKAASGDDLLEQSTCGFIGGKTYATTYTISSQSGMGVASGVFIYVSGTAGTLRTADGTYTENIIALSSGGDLSFTPSHAAPVSFKIDDVTVKELSNVGSLWEQALLQTLYGDAAVAAYIGSSSSGIYNGYAPTTKDKPFVIYSQISGPRDQTFDGPSGLVTIHIQLNSFASTYLEARTIADVIRRKLDGFEGTVSLTGGGSCKILETKMTDEGDVATEQSDTIVVYGKRQDYEMVIDERP